MALLEAFRGYSRDIPVEKFLQEYQDHYNYTNMGDVVKKSALAVEFKVEKNIILITKMFNVYISREHLMLIRSV